MKFVPNGLINDNCIGLYNGLSPNRRQAIIWTNANPIHWRIYAALTGDELTACCSKVLILEVIQRMCTTDHSDYAHHLNGISAYIDINFKQ